MQRRKIVQHCRNLTRKDLLKQHLERHVAMFSSSSQEHFFSCMPTTFSLPREYAAFEAAFQTACGLGHAGTQGSVSVQVLFCSCTQAKLQP
jgi:hypothetical protein